MPFAGQALHHGPAAAQHRALHFVGTRAPIPCLGRKGRRGGQWERMGPGGVGLRGRVKGTAVPKGPFRKGGVTKKERRQ